MALSDPHNDRPPNTASPRENARGIARGGSTYRYAACYPTYNESRILQDKYFLLYQPWNMNFNQLIK